MDFSWQRFNAQMSETITTQDKNFRIHPFLLM